MYALLNSQNELVDGKPLMVFPIPSPFTSEGKSYPRQWFGSTSDAEKKLVHIFPYVELEVPDGHEFGDGDVTYTFDGSAVVGTPASIAIPVDVIKNGNRDKAIGAQDDILYNLQRNTLRIDNGLPGLYNDAEIKGMQQELVRLQSAVDNPSADPTWAPESILDKSETD